MPLKKANLGKHMAGAGKVGAAVSRKADIMNWAETAETPRNPPREKRTL